MSASFNGINSGRPARALKEPIVIKRFGSAVVGAVAVSLLVVMLAVTIHAQTAGGGGGKGSFTDTRDGKTYRTVRIGNYTWMAENLNHQTNESWCYGDDKSNCDKYGRLYT